MDKVAVGKEASPRTDSETYFRTYQCLLKQKEQIDRDILKLQRKFSRVISQNKGILTSKRVTYVSRLKNTTTLVKAIRNCMIPNKEMTMKDILKSLSKNKLYHTKSHYFYTMVNNKLNKLSRDNSIEKLSRGVFVYRPKCRKHKDVAA